MKMNPIMKAARAVIALAPRDRALAMEIVQEFGGNGDGGVEVEVTATTGKVGKAKTKTGGAKKGPRGATSDVKVTGKYAKLMKAVDDDESLDSTQKARKRWKIRQRAIEDGEVAVTKEEKEKLAGKGKAPAKPAAKSKAKGKPAPAAADEEDDDDDDETEIDDAAEAEDEEEEDETEDDDDEDE